MGPLQSASVAQVAPGGGQQILPVHFRGPGQLHDPPQPSPPQLLRGQLGVQPVEPPEEPPAVELPVVVPPPVELVPLLAPVPVLAPLPVVVLAPVVVPPLLELVPWPLLVPPVVAGQGAPSGPQPPDDPEVEVRPPLVPEPLALEVPEVFGPVEPPVAARHLASSPGAQHRFDTQAMVEGQPPVQARKPDGIPWG